MWTSADTNATIVLDAERFATNKGLAPSIVREYGRWALNTPGIRRGDTDEAFRRFLAERFS